MIRTIKHTIKDGDKLIGEVKIVRNQMIKIKIRCDQSSRDKIIGHVEELLRDVNYE